MHLPRFIARVPNGLGLIAVFVLLLVTEAAAGTAARTIHTVGPLTQVIIGADLSCQVGAADEGGFEFFPAGGAPGDCGTFLAAGGTLYGPDFAGHPSTATSFASGTYAPFTPTAQSAITGSGTAEHPYTVQTTVTAGSTGLSLSELDQYAVGNDGVRTDVTITNGGTQPATVVLYRGAHCDVVVTDAGYGFVSGLGAPSCVAHPGDVPPGRLDELSPITAGARYAEGPFASVWQDIASGAALPDSCACASFSDNAIALGWAITIPAGHTALRSLVENVSATGHARGDPLTVSGPWWAGSSSGAATVTGAVNPQGSTVADCHFDWGRSAAYGHSIPCSEKVGSGDAPVTVSAVLTGLAHDGVYHYRLSATNAVGPSAGGDVTLTLSGSSSTSTPTVGQSVAVLPVSGTVLVRTPQPGHTAAATSALPPKGSGFVPLTEPRVLPVGSQIDALRGTLSIVAGSGGGGSQQVRLTGGVFGVAQAAGGLQKGLTTFTLAEGAFSGGPSYRSCTASGPRTSARAAGLSRKVLQTLHATESHGKFRTRGTYSAGTVRGTDWTTSDRCDGTLTVVRRGTVSVLNLRTRRTVAVHAGHRYLARAPRG